jgi:hypothetical protein
MSICMRTTVRLRDDLLRRAKKRAAEEGRTLTAMIEEGLMLVLLKQGAGPREGRPPLPVSKATGGVHPGIDMNNSGELSDVLDGA